METSAISCGAALAACKKTQEWQHAVDLLRTLLEAEGKRLHPATVPLLVRAKRDKSGNSHWPCSAPWQGPKLKQFIQQQCEARVATRIGLAQHRGKCQMGAVTISHYCAIRLRRNALAMGRCKGLFIPLRPDRSFFETVSVLRQLIILGAFMLMGSFDCPSHPPVALACPLYIVTGTSTAVCGASE